MMTCRHCGLELPEEQFELYPSGTRRRVCRRCKYELYSRPAWQRWWQRQRARALNIVVK